MLGTNSTESTFCCTWTLCSCQNSHFDNIRVPTKLASVSFALLNTYIYKNKQFNLSIIQLRTAQLLNVAGLHSVPKSGREDERKTEREKAGNTINLFSYVANKRRIECPWLFALWVKHLKTLFSQFSRELRVSLLMQCGDLLRPPNNYVSSIIILPINQFKTSFNLVSYALWALFTYWIQTVRQLRLLWLIENKRYVFRLLSSQLQQALEELFKSSSKESEVLAIRSFPLTPVFVCSLRG